MKIRKILFYLLVSFALCFSFNFVTCNQCYADDGDEPQEGDTILDPFEGGGDDEPDDSLGVACDGQSLELEPSNDAAVKHPCLLPCKKVGEIPWNVGCVIGRLGACNWIAEIANCAGSCLRGSCRRFSPIRSACTCEISRNGQIIYLGGLTGPYGTLCSCR